jgi:hypothetical protein
MLFRLCTCRMERLCFYPLQRPSARFMLSLWIVGRDWPRLSGVSD